MFIKILLRACKKIVFYSIYIKLICIYIHLSYRFEVKVVEKILERWPGNNGFHFPQSYENPVGEIKKKLESNTKKSSLKLRDTPQKNSSSFANIDCNRLSGSRFLIVSSSATSASSNLTELASAHKPIIESLGAFCEVVSIATLRKQVNHSGQYMDLDFVVIDPFLNSAETEFLFSPQIGLKRYSPNVRFICICYDLWRPSDELVIRRLNPFVYIFLHADPIMVKVKFSDLESKFFIWPIARSWKEFDHYTFAKLKRKNQLYFSGSVDPLDRREILNAAINFTKNTEMNTHFLATDTRCSFLTPNIEKYLSNLIINRCILSPSQKSKEHWIITGRAFDVLKTSGSGVLLHQEGNNCRPLSEFFTPYEDYLPFDCSEGLKELILWCDKNEPKVSEIANSGNVKFRQIFTSTYMSGIFS